MWKLIEAFGRLLEKAGPKVTHDVVFDRVSISARINQIIDRLEIGGGSFRFDSLFDLSASEADVRSQVVVTLLAILELAKLRVVRVLASEDQETLFITQVAGSTLAEARRAEVTSDDEGEPPGDGEEPVGSDGAVVAAEASEETTASHVPSEGEPIAQSEAMSELDPQPETDAETTPEIETRRADAEDQGN